MRLTRLLRDQSGASAIEYALVASLIAIAAVAATANLGTTVNATYSGVEAKLG